MARWHAFIRDTAGATLTEFAFVAPVFIVLLFGVFDAAHTQYTASVVNGAMQKAGRDLSLENSGSNMATLDRKVEEMVRIVAPSASVTMSRLSHYDFSDIGQAEAFSDDDNDGICNNGEVFEDANRNSRWDADRGAQGVGGARDAVVYTANINYPRLFPMARLIGLPEEINLEASTVMRNQPYDNQDRSVTTGNCP